MISNKYKTEGDITYIYFKDYKDNDVTALVDTEDLPKIRDSKYKLYCKWIPRSKRNYIVQTEYLGLNEDGTFSNKTTYLHRLLMDCPDGMDVDHINHNTLDNRKSNLRIVPRKYNMRNRKGLNSNNTSGYRNVSLIDNKWVVQLQVNGKNKRLGAFDDVHEAGVYAKEMREKYYGKYAGKG